VFPNETPLPPRAFPNPHDQLVDEQLNGGELVPLSEADWDMILPYLQDNEKPFHIKIDRDLLTGDGEIHPPAEINRKVQAVKLAILTKGEDSWE
jgi:hypothetical protein